MEAKDPKLAESLKRWNTEHPYTIKRRMFLDLDEEELQMRFAVDEQKNQSIVGYAAVFNKRTELFDGFWEQIQPGAFSESMNSRDVYALFNHVPSEVLANTGAGNLFLTEDARGLKYTINPLPDTSLAREVKTLVKTGIIRKSSFGFRIKEYGDQKIDRGILRTIVKAEPLYDVSLVTYPAYKDTDAHVRMIEGEFEKAYVFDNGMEPIIVRAIEEPPPVVEPPAQSDAELFGAFDEVITFKR